MQISFHHTNPAAGHESTLLKIHPYDSDPYWYLIDAGESVTPAAFMGAEETLDGVFLTHAHSDHYESLGSVLSAATDTPLFTSPGTAAIIEQVYAEADTHRDLGNAEEITTSLTPVDSWTSLTDEVDILPIPAGHTPGAAAFLFRIDDLSRNNETITLLATGDFTTQSVAGYPGISVPADVQIDIMIANAPTSDDFNTNLETAISTIFERSLAGSTTLVAGSALTGIHIAYLLNQVLANADRELPINLVGHGAKLYEALGYDLPFVTTHEQFDHTDDVLTPGGITIAGPETPDSGSTQRLFGVIKNDPDAVFAQLSTAGLDGISSISCTTHQFKLANHPTETQFINWVEQYLPRHLILKHVPPTATKTITASFDSLLHWENDDTNEHRLYDDGDFLGPAWMSEASVQRIQKRNFMQSGNRMLLDGPIEELPTAPLGRDSDTAVESFEINPILNQASSEDHPNPPSQHSGLSAASEIQADESPDSSDKQATGNKADESTTGSQVDSGFKKSVTERLTSIESSLDNLSDSVSETGVIQSEVNGLKSKLDDVATDIDDVTAGIDNLQENAISSEIEEVKQSVTAVESEVSDLSEEIRADTHSLTAQVVRQDELVLLRVDPAQLADAGTIPDHGEELEIAIRQSEWE